MRQTYLDMAIKMAELGSESLQATYRHSRQFLRGVTDFDDDGNYAWKRGAYAATAYQFSKKAAPTSTSRTTTRSCTGNMSFR